MQNCLYILLAYFIGLTLIILFQKREDKSQFLKSVFLQAAKNTLWMVPLSALVFGIGAAAYSLRYGSSNFLSMFTFGAILGVVIGLAVSIGEAGRKFGMRW